MPPSEVVLTQSTHILCAA